MPHRYGIAPGASDSTFEQQATNLVDDCGATHHPALPYPMQGLQIQLAIGLDRYKAHLRPSDCLSNRLGIGSLLRLAGHWSLQGDGCDVNPGGPRRRYVPGLQRRSRRDANPQISRTIGIASTNRRSSQDVLATRRAKAEIALDRAFNCRHVVNSVWRRLDEATISSDDAKTRRSKHVV
jgi:hypothetical protein